MTAPGARFLYVGQRGVRHLERQPAVSLPALDISVQGCRPAHSCHRGWRIDEIVTILAPGREQRGRALRLPSYPVRCVIDRAYRWRTSASKFLSQLSQFLGLLGEQAELLRQVCGLEVEDIVRCPGSRGLVREFKSA
jgi:hypothetical protein